MSDFVSPGRDSLNGLKRSINYSFSSKVNVLSKYKGFILIIMEIVMVLKPLSDLKPNVIGHVKLCLKNVSVMFSYLVVTFIILDVFYYSFRISVVIVS